MINKDIAEKILRHFLENELADYLSPDEWKLEHLDDDDDIQYFDLNTAYNDLELRVTLPENAQERFKEEAAEDDGDEEYLSDAEVWCTIEVNIYEDWYEEIKSFDWQIKHFWIALFRNSVRSNAFSK